MYQAQHTPIAYSDASRAQETRKGKIVTDSPCAAPAHLRTRHLQTAMADASENSLEASIGAQLTRGVIRGCGGLRLARGARTPCQRHGSLSVHDLQGCGPCLGAR
jgi:hypothetical protein